MFKRKFFKKSTGTPDIPHFIFNRVFPTLEGNKMSAPVRILPAKYSNSQSKVKKIGHNITLKGFVTTFGLFRNGIKLGQIIMIEGARARFARYGQN